MGEETLPLLEENKTSQPPTVALVDFEALFLNDSRKSPHRKLVSLLESRGIEIQPFGSFDYRNLPDFGRPGYDIRLPINSFFENKDFSFLTRFDPYCKQDSWGDYYQKHYSDNLPSDTVEARDLYYEIFVRLRLLDSGALEPEYFFDGFAASDYNKEYQSEEWAKKLEDLQNIIIKSTSTHSEEKGSHTEAQFKEASESLLDKLREFYKDELSIVQGNPFLNYEWGGPQISSFHKVRNFKGDLFACALHRLHERGVRKVIIFEENEDQIQHIKNIYERLSKIDPRIPYAAIFSVKDKIPEDVEYLHEAAPKPSTDEKNIENLVYDLESDFEQLYKDSQPQATSRKPAPSTSASFGPIACGFCLLFTLYPFVALWKTRKTSALATLGVLTSLSFIGSFLSESQNQVLFKGLSDGFREDFITSLMAPCAHLPGNDATYVSGAVLLLLMGVGYCFRNTIKKEIDSPGISKMLGR